MAMGDRYQILLIASGVAATALFGVFFYRELFPEYKIYQDDYVALEEFRSTYTHEPPPAFKLGVKQIVIEASDKGPPVIDRCTSCHVALQFEHFSPTRVGFDINGEVRRDENGFPVKIPNEDYIWKHLDDTIAALEDAEANAALEKQGKGSEVSERLAEAKRLAKLKTAKVGHKVYDVTQVLQMHPLMGRETRPFEFHPVEEYGCVVCHNGNGRGLTTEKAHGPVFDEQYEVEFMGPKPEFLELDPANDPKFSRVFNDKPGHELLFQTSPIFVGGLIEAKCVQCHQSAQNALQGVSDSAKVLISQREKRSQAITTAYQGEKEALLATISLWQEIQKEGIQATFDRLQLQSTDYRLPVKQLEAAIAQLGYLQRLAGTDKIAQMQAAQVQEKIQANLQQTLIEALGSETLVKALTQDLEKGDQEKVLEAFVKKHAQEPEATGTFFVKAEQAQLDQELMRHVKETGELFTQSVGDEQTINAMTTDVDLLTRHFSNGQGLFLSQACYACHRIAGYARGGVGPELTQEGDTYPWFIKESIVWPQADLKSSTMPNYKLDHNEVEDLVTYLLAQKGNTKAVSEAVYKISLAEWEAGRKLPWEKPVTPTEMHSVRFGMTVFATQGCAACHRLEGFESNVGFAVEKTKPDFETLHSEREWFQKLFPEYLTTTELVASLEKNALEIDKRIVDNVRKDSIIEEIQSKYPGTIEAFYPIFKQATRAKDKFFDDRLASEKDSSKKVKIAAESKQWKERVQRVLMQYIQEYGLGRLVGPRPNWSGVYRSDEWLMEHFRAPTNHIPRSIMPVFPFDDTKFYALTYMLDVLGIRNRDAVRQIWQERGFSPALAYQIHCAQCHGDERLGNGPVAEWIYPIPKNLRNAFFLRNLTKEEAIQSIMHGVRGTPMPPWSETPQDKATYDGKPVLTENEVQQLVDWMFNALPGESSFESDEETPKWQYSPEDVLKELKNEGQELRKKDGKSPLSFLLRNPKHFLASLSPMPVPQDNQVAEVFDVIPNPLENPKNFYYIKKEYYTPENIRAGEEFFQLNCAVCHGKDADGQGNRAGVMQDAKPRILVNLDWLQTRDDLRLLRSIKYGVLGTSMTPWGDQTSSLQRLQLVMYIRTLSRENILREKLTSTIYQTFDTMEQVVLKGRSNNYQDVETNEQAYLKALKSQRLLASQAEEGEASPDQALKAFQEQLSIGALSTQWKNADQLLAEVLSLIKKEREIYQGMGLALIQNVETQDEFEQFLKALALNAKRFEVTDKVLKAHVSPEALEQVQLIRKKVLEELDSQIATTKQTLDATTASGDAQTVEVQVHELNNELNNLAKLKTKLIAGFEEVGRLRDQQIQLVEQYNQKIQELRK